MLIQFTSKFTTNKNYVPGKKNNIPNAEEQIHLLLCIRGVRVRISVWRLADFTKCIDSFIQFLQDNYGIVSSERLRRLPSRFLPIHSLHLIVDLLASYVSNSPVTLWPQVRTPVEAWVYMRTFPVLFYPLYVETLRSDDFPIHCVL